MFWDDLWCVIHQTVRPGIFLLKVFEVDAASKMQMQHVSAELNGINLNNIRVRGFQILNFPKI